MVNHLKPFDAFKYIVFLNTLGNNAFHLYLYNDILLLTCNNDALNSVENEKVLGVRIDNNQTWSIHIKGIATKISSNLWLLSKLKDYLSTEHRVILQNIYLTPHLLLFYSMGKNTSI